MSYARPGYEPWGVTNPYVFANFGQPQRQRGYVSPVIFKTHGPTLSNRTLGDASEEMERAKRMEKLALIGLGLSAVSVGVSLMYLGRLKKNKTKRRRR